jgi:hypothetical protein
MRRSQAHARHSACGRQRRHASHASVSLQGKVNRSAPSPIMRPVTTKRIPVRVSSLARARSSHREQESPEPGTNGRRRLSGTKAAYFPRRDTKTLFPPSPSKKRSRVAAPGRTVFNFPCARPLSPALRSELQTDRP